MKNLISLFFISILFLSCSSDDNTASPKVVINYLALGDSYTIGQGVEAVESWPKQLVVELLKNQYVVNNTKIIAQTGWTTEDLLVGIEADNPLGYNLVSLLIGVNNQFRNQSLEEFQPKFDTILQKAIELSGEDRKIFVVSIPDYSVTPFGSISGPDTSQEIDMYNSYIEQQCLVRDIPYIDVTEISRSLGSSEGALAEDNLHPSGLQYALWVEEILPVITPMLSQ
jgi:lysophospholipase L1-like esterase